MPEPQGDVLALIDGAVRDWETSGDATTPADPARSRPVPVLIAVARAERERERWRAIAAGDLSLVTPADVGLAVETWGAIVETWGAIRDAVIEQCRQMGEALLRLKPALEEFAQAFAGPAEAATRAAASPRVPTYRDARPRWQSPYGPARRTR